MNNKHLSWNKEINNNFIIASTTYFLDRPLSTRRPADSLRPPPPPDDTEEDAEGQVGFP